jgi:LysM repeat protein
MSDGDVSEWLEMNPEATLVIMELTATVAAGSSDKPPAATMIPTIDKTLMVTPTVTPTAVECGPPADWVLHTVKAEETLYSIATAYGITVDDLKYANCRGDSTTIIVGENLFVPNVPTITPTPTKTPLPTSTPKPTTAAPTNSPSVFSAPQGPVADGGQLSDPAQCNAKYSINVTDADTVKEVKMIYSLDGSVPDWNTAVGAGKYKLLADKGGGTYENIYTIPSWNATGGLVKYRFAVKDGAGVISYYPATGALSFNDFDILCGAPTNFIAVSAPETPIDAVSPVCPRDYQVTVTDLNGISDVRLYYKIEGTAYPDITLGYLGGNDYGITGFTIDTSAFTAPVTIQYEFKALDGHGNWSKMPTTFSFVDNFGCTLP